MTEGYGGPIVRCPECMKRQMMSTVEVVGQFRTMMTPTVYFDEEGRQHIHDPNTVTSTYQCSNGHRWQQGQKGYCWCGWPENRNESQGDVQ